jgi:hypothetical protein
MSFLQLAHRYQKSALPLLFFASAVLFNGFFPAAFGDDLSKGNSSQTSGSNPPGNIAWPDKWMVYTTLNETDVDLVEVRQLPPTINGTPGRSMLFVNGTLSLLQQGEKPTAKRPGFVFATLHSDKNQTIEMGCAANWWMECCLNGVVICDTLQSGEGRTASERILQLPLKQGDNLLAFKVLSGKGGWSLTLIPPIEAASYATMPFNAATDNTILDTDFHDAEVKTYDNGQVIGNGPEVSQMTVLENYRPSKVIVSSGDDKKPYLMFISDKTTTLIHPTCAAMKVIPYNVSTQDNLYIKGYMAFSPLSIPAGATQGNVDIMIMSTALNILTAPRQIGFINIRPSFLKSHVIAGRHYRLDFSIDCSDKIQHTWAWSLYEEGNPTALFTSGTQKTRDPLGQPALFAVTGAGTPYLAIERVHLSAGIVKK